MLHVARALEYRRCSVESDCQFSGRGSLESRTLRFRSVSERSTPNCTQNGTFYIPAKATRNGRAVALIFMQHFELISFLNPRLPTVLLHWLSRNSKFLLDTMDLRRFLFNLGVTQF